MCCAPAKFGGAFKRRDGDMTRRDDIHAAALRHMRRAQAEGWHAQSMITDKAVQALILDGYSEQDATAAVQVVWAQRFEITPPC